MIYIGLNFILTNYNKMQKIEFKVHFQEIVYKIKPKKSFIIHLTKQDQGGLQVSNEEVTIPSDQNTIQLSHLSPFESFFIMNEDKSFYRPHTFYFISGLTPIITRKIPLHLGKFYNHYRNAPFEQIKQIYTFQQGKILYKVSVNSSQTVTGQQQIQHYEFKFNQFNSYSSSKILIESMPSQEVINRTSKRPKPRPSFELKEDQIDENNSVKLDAQETKDMDDPQQSQKGNFSDQEYIKSWHDIEIEQKKQCQAEQARACKRESTQKNILLKVIVILLTILFVIMAYNANQDPKRRTKAAKKAGKVSEKVAYKNQVTKKNKIKR